MKITAVGRIDAKTHKAVFRGLRTFNAKFAARQFREFSVCAKEDGKIVGGATGSSKFDWLHVQLLWVDPTCRGKDIGTKVMKRVERIAKKRTCAGIHLETFSFQALGFYKKLGYTVFGFLPDRPRGHKQYFLLKRLR